MADGIASSSSSAPPPPPSQPALVRPALAQPQRPKPQKHVSFAKTHKGPTGMNGPLYMQSSSNVVIVRRVKRKNETPTKQFTRWLVENQTGLAFNLLALLFLAHSFFPKLRVHTTKFFTLSYYNPVTDNYNLGQDDSYLIAFFVTVLTGLRTSLMEYVFAPFGKSRGLSRRKEITRFSEQGWMLLYYTIIFPMGYYIYWKSDYYLSLENLWTHWPNREMNGLLKTYILIQLSFWLHQIMVINIEERRKDHWQMLTHHFITVSLVVASYRYRHTPVANIIQVLMDVSDFFLPLAKCLKYLGHSTLCDVCFGAFMISWFIPRHIFFPMICYSVWSQTPRIMPVGCFRGGLTNDGTSVAVALDEVSYLEPAVSKALPFLASKVSNKLAFLIEPLVDANGAICYNDTVRTVFLTLLLFLQALILVWFIMIVRVAIRVVKGVGADDTRSDDEADSEDEELEDEEDEELVSYEEAQALEEEVGVEAIDFKGWERRSGVKRSASSSTGVSLPGHSDRKELLGRIGCEKQVD